MAAPQTRAVVRIEDVLDQAEVYCDNAALDLIRRAYVFSARWHKDQVRRSGEPYLIHPIEVASILSEMRLDAPAIATGLLHDVLEDTLADRATIEQHFGAEIAHMVEGVTKISKMAFTSREAEQAENFRKMLLAMVDDIRIILVKLADRLHNMRTLHHLAEDKRRRIASETLDIYAPLANRLGIGKIKGELEDLAFRHLWPEEFSALSHRIQDKRQVSDEFIAAVRARLAEACQSHAIEAQIDGRVKRLYSIWQKIQRQHIPLDEVYDYIAFRVVTSSVRDCYALLGIVHGMWTPIPGRIKDYIAMPKPNLYRSLHTTVMSDQGQPFEIQIRTREMHAVAEEGIAAHWSYKEGVEVSGPDSQSFAWLRSLVELGKEVKDPREFLDSVKVDLYPTEVYAFTPRGMVLSFPRGATAIDFAYAIHTEVGHRCVGARVNGKLVALRTQLRNGDIVEILTDKDHHPSRDWLKIVVTTRAQNKIRQWLHVEERRRAVEIGRSKLEQELSRAHVDRTPDEAEMAGILAGLGLAKLDDLYAAVSYGKVDARHVVSRLAPARPAEGSEGGAEPRARTRERTGSDPTGISVTGYGDMLVSLARCCNPIRGDRIVGYITRGRGVAVHNIGCRNVKNLLFDPGRRIDVSWTGAEPGSTYRVGLRIHTEDRPGMLAKITSRIAGQNTNIKHVEANTSEDRKGLIQLTVEIPDVEHLETLCRSLEEIDGVLRVARVMQ